MIGRSDAAAAIPAEQRPVDLLAACFTLAGGVFPGSPSEISSLPFEERVAAAGAAGFRGFGLGYADLEATADRLGLSTMRSIDDPGGAEYPWGLQPTREPAASQHPSLGDAAIPGRPSGL